MSRGRTRGRRYDEEPKLNMKKVFAVANSNSSNNHVYIHNKRTIKQRHNNRKNNNKKLLCNI